MSRDRFNSNVDRKVKTEAAPIRRVKVIPGDGTASGTGRTSKSFRSSGVGTGLISESKKIAAARDVSVNFVQADLEDGSA
jgi:hypothetical protein